MFICSFVSVKFVKLRENLYSESCGSSTWCKKTSFHCACRHHYCRGNDHISLLRAVAGASSQPGRSTFREIPARGWSSAKRNAWQRIVCLDSLLTSWHPDDGCGLLPLIICKFRPFVSLQPASARFRFLVPLSGTTCLSTTHLRRHSPFSDNDSRPFCFPVPTKTLSYDSCVTVTIHHYCLDTCGPCNN